MLVLMRISSETDRNMFMAHMKDCGIQTSIHYPPIHKFSHFRKLLGNRPRLPITEQVAKNVVTLPLFPSMTHKDIDYIIDTILSYKTSKEAML